MEAISQLLEAAEQAYAGMDPASFDQATERLSQSLPCLEDFVTPPLAARYHRLEGIRLFSAGGLESSILAMKAARVLEPEYRFPDEFLDRGHELRTRYEEIDAGAFEDIRIAKPREGEVRVDGIVAQTRPADRAALVQIVDVVGAVESTAYIFPDDPIPSYEAVPNTRTPLLVASAGLAVGAATLYGMSWASYAKFDRDDPDYVKADLDRYRSQANTCAVLSGTFAGLAVAGGATALIVGAW